MSDARTSPVSSTGRQPVETIVVHGHRVACDGGGGPLGHPKVWYELGADGEVECLYCGRVYVQAADAGH